MSGLPGDRNRFAMAGTADAFGLTVEREPTCEACDWTEMRAAVPQD
jgi:hypothetical protein